MNQVQVFHDLARVDKIFTPRDYDVNKVASMWYSFSLFIPKLLAKLALLSTSEKVFSRLISISSEEMGDGNVDSIHSELFKIACESHGIEIDEKLEVRALTKFKNIGNEELNDSFILGLHLGLEIIANENIQHLIDTLTDEQGKIKSTRFFKIHLVNEDVHIEKCVNNFLMCKTEKDKQSFMSGFDFSLGFWSDYWIEASK